MKDTRYVRIILADGSNRLTENASPPPPASNTVRTISFNFLHYSLNIEDLLEWRVLINSRRIYPLCNSSFMVDRTSSITMY